MSDLHELRAITGLSAEACNIARKHLNSSYADLKLFYMEFGRFPTVDEVEFLNIRLVGGHLDMDAVAKLIRLTQGEWKEEK